MNDFLINLALRAVGVPNFAGIATPSTWNEPEELSTEKPPFLEEIRQEQFVPEPSLSMEKISQERLVPAPLIIEESDRKFAGSPRPSLPERTYAASYVADPKTNPEPQPAHLLIPSAPEQIREISNEQREIVQQNYPTPPTEVREVVREREIVHEKIIENKVHTETLPPIDKTVAVPPAIQTPATPKPKPKPKPKPNSEPILRDLVREVILEKSTQPQPSVLMPAAQSNLFPPLKKNTVDRELELEIPHEKGTRASPESHETAVSAISTPKQAESVQPSYPTPKSETVQEDSHGSPTISTVLRPSPLFEPSAVGTPGSVKTHKLEKNVEVKIGSIEIRSSAPPPPPVSTKAHEETAAHIPPVEGFENYRFMRQYSAWFWEKER